jgi:plastocyanin
MSRPAAFVLAALLAMLALGRSLEALAATQAQMVNCTAAPGWCFSPAVTNVAAGSSLTWNNSSSAPHTATADDGSWTAGTPANPISAGSSGTVTFANPGTFTYHCALHPNMHGTVVVTVVVATPSPSAAVVVTPAPSAPPVGPSASVNHMHGLAHTGGGREPPGPAPLIFLGAILVGLGIAFRNAPPPRRSRR